MSAHLEVHNLRASRGGRQVLAVDTLNIQPGEMLAVIGPNGAGKSTLLLALSRLITLDSGEIWLNGQPALQQNDLAYRRRLGLVLQEPLLLDTNVYYNVAAGLRFRGLPEAHIRQRVNGWLERLGILNLSSRSARQLSGGEAQRVSLARAFALEPELLMLDEPFSALDAPTRLRLLDELQTILQSAQATTIFITHDLDEALRFGQRIAVLIGGRLRQTGSPQDVFNTPADPDVAAFVGIETIIPAVVTRTQDGLVTVKVNGKAMIETTGDAQLGQAVLVCLRPEDITLWPVASALRSSARNQLQGIVKRLSPQGALLRVTVDCGFPLTALVTRLSAQELGLAQGVPVSATFKASAAHLLKK